MKLRKDTWTIVLLILCCLGLIVVVIFEVYLVSKIVGSPIPSHWRTMWLGQLLLFSLLLCYLVLFAFVVSPTVTSCVILRFGVGVCYAMCFSVLLVKLMIIMSSASIGYLKGIYQFLMFVFAWGVQVSTVMIIMMMIMMIMIMMIILMIMIIILNIIIIIINLILIIQWTPFNSIAYKPFNRIKLFWPEINLIYGVHCNTNTSTAP